MGRRRPSEQRTRPLRVLPFLMLAALPRKSCVRVRLCLSAPSPFRLTLSSSFFPTREQKKSNSLRARTQKTTSCVCHGSNRRRHPTRPPPGDPSFFFSFFLRHSACNVHARNAQQGGVRATMNKASQGIKLRRRKRERGRGRKRKQPLLPRVSPLPLAWQQRE